MGYVPRTKLIVLIVCFCITGLLIYRKAPSVVSRKGIDLDKALAQVPGWHMIQASPMDTKIVQALKLDDYIMASFSSGPNRVTLYIGYYFTDKKLGAAHDPMVCFPGQGWTLSQVKSGSMQFNGSGPYHISYSTMVADKGGQKELIVYWFQSYDKTNANTFSQKISSFFQRITHGSEGNAFVRISTSLNGKSEQDAKEAIQDFIQAFYPLFLKYIKDEAPS